MPINPRDPFRTSYPLVRSRRAFHAQVGTTHSQTHFLGADILDVYLEYLIVCRFLSADSTGVLTIKARFLDLTYEPYINLPNVEKYLFLLGFTPTLATSGVKYTQTRYSKVQSLPDYEKNVLPTIKQLWAANPPY
ncbi:hypothetical protein KKJ06_19850 [Xenorhabdus bovienii]|uniref:hypothetical protein n=1 Tax=Xenorhabdus bovienii TaxID=40576 RepID=UPI0023B2FDD7|nr:hypothetical protein [Xenorhabdus bovienii]MDE9545061.1 hypothetical protein [Xenorhabdus bovienii]MDE9553201.1 hypothetical protein [Xenorhabdus bovienii]MDE9557611.1 hypothetical protein [Xenorhabdus bovienii]